MVVGQAFGSWLLGLPSVNNLAFFIPWAKVEVGFRRYSVPSGAKTRFSRALLCIIVKYRVISAQQYCKSCPVLVTATVIGEQ